MRTLNVESLRGLPEATAISKIQSAGFRSRVISRDGKYIVTTKDFRVDRVNLQINNGRVTQVSLG